MTKISEQTNKTGLGSNTRILTSIETTPGNWDSGYETGDTIAKQSDLVSTDADVNSLDTRVTNLENSQVSGYIPVETFADLPATGVVDTAYVVINDPDDTKNGTYTWNGSSYDYLGNPTSSTVNENSTTVPVNGKAVNDFFYERLQPLLQKEDAVFVDQNFNVAGWVNESTTFSGWGCEIGTFSEFNQIRFKLRGFDVSFPITQFRVRIRENDHLGTVLADVKWLTL